MTRLKELRIHGFKSFANATAFVFDEGVTAIVGPNGSGKSNVAEALRWVLGEQHYTALRGRRTEDVIFAGSERRGQLGMAEVTLLLDNSEGGLATEYQEVALSRRAFRSGENQYVTNGSRVRLKDVQQLTASLGQAHTIIGQGLVDAVLSQRPEDRRGLFEHAAGITGLRLRTAEAERSLAEAAGNAQRLHDMLAELEPRVRSLERAARQAREYGALRDRMSELQRGYYAGLWASANERQTATQAALATAEEVRAAAEAAQRHVAQQLNSVRARERELITRISTLQRGLADRERAAAELAHQVELLDAARANSARRAGELEAARAELNAQHARAVHAEQAAQEVLCALQTAVATAQRDLAEHETAHADALSLIAVQKETLAGLENELAALNRELADIEAQRSRQRERQVVLDEERMTRADRLREEQAAVAKLEDMVAALDAQLMTERRDLTELQCALDACSATAAQHGANVRAARDAVDAVQRTRTELRTQLEVLERSAASGEGLHGGARAIQNAVRRQRLRLPGLIGTLAELIEAPDELETAIEVALGGHLQDLVVERWADAEQAIDFLKRGNAGRATFQPLETVKRPRPATLDVADPDLLGSAYELIGCRSDVAAVLAQLLQRTLVVRDLDGMRRLLDQSRGWTIVTLSGEIARPGGSVTGGGAVRSAGLLARERERRELPAQLRSIDKQHAQACAVLAEAERLLADAEQQHTQVATELAELQHTERATAAHHTRATQDCTQAHERMERARAALTAVEERSLNLEKDAQQLDARLAPLTATRAERQAEVERVRALPNLSAPPDDTHIVALKVELGALGERLSAAERDQWRAREAAQAAEQAGAVRAAELIALREQQEQNAAQRDGVAREHAALCIELDERRRAIPPLEQDRAGLLDQIRAAERAIDLAVGRLREAERARDNAALNLARVRDEQTFLTERIQTDLELEDPADLAGVPALSGTEVEQEIRRLRERLRRTSAVGAEVIDEHAQEAARLEHLTRELADVEQAAERLRQLLSDLRRGMQQRFQTTFEQVAAEFERTFSRLFGGGAARLTHLSGDNGDAGVVIEARPPGKRLQNLGQLSGGERALTAVALLFAIQRVNPSPFCVLDEVDAALDESNVLRFRDELRDLARTTQYIVITHNRGTIEGADTLYGITMGEDSVSRVVSLRLEQAIQQVEERRQIGQTAS